MERNLFEKIVLFPLIFFLRFPYSSFDDSFSCLERVGYILAMLKHNGGEKRKIVLS
jgi:hypothetical protein